MYMTKSAKVSVHEEGIRKGHMRTGIVSWFQNWSPRFVVVLLANVLVGHVEMVQILFYYIKFASM
jgi:hypothetical protein